MRISGDGLQRSIAACLVMLLAVPFAEAATARVRPALPSQQAAGASSVSPKPDSKPAASPTQSNALPSNPSARQQSATPLETPAASQPPAQQQQNSTSVPVGTAAAPYVKALGIPASRPAGAAIAPAKQKRAHSFLIKVGVIVGAAIAVGTVVGLSKASPSRPN